MKLPDKPSELLRLAIKDLEACEEDPRYKIDMGRWHHAFHDTCYVCLAGAVMANTLKADVEQKLSPKDLEVADKLHSLDDFRIGAVTDGIARCSRKTNVKDFDAITYSVNPEEFKKQMLDLADKLEKEGN